MFKNVLPVLHKEKWNYISCCNRSSWVVHLYPVLHGGAGVFSQQSSSCLLLSTQIPVGPNSQELNKGNLLQTTELTFNVNYCILQQKKKNHCKDRSLGYTEYWVMLRLHYVTLSCWLIVRLCMFRQESEMLNIQWYVQKCIHFKTLILHITVLLLVLLVSDTLLKPWFSKWCPGTLENPWCISRDIRFLSYNS